MFLPKKNRRQKKSKKRLERKARLSWAIGFFKKKTQTPNTSRPKKNYYPILWIYEFLRGLLCHRFPQRNRYQDW